MGLSADTRAAGSIGSSGSNTAPDTIDLQDPEAPSAKEHPRHISSSTIAPHQAETLRDIAHETAEVESRSPRVSWSHGDPLAGGGGIGAGAHLDDSNMASVNGKLHQHQSQEDSLAVAQNGGLSSSDEGDMDGDGDDLDDDMMDRISSSPSIEDGALYDLSPLTAHVVPLRWPRRVSSLPPHMRSRTSSLEHHVQVGAPVLPLPSSSQHKETQALQPSSQHHHRPLPRRFSDRNDPTTTSVPKRPERYHGNKARKEPDNSPVLSG